MKNLKHTPGPWKAHKPKESNGWHDIRQALDNGLDKDIATTFYDNAGHNARLIAAAPEMLEAIVYLLRVTDPYRTGGMQHQREAISMSVAIIEKATGMKIEEVLS